MNRNEFITFMQHPEKLGKENIPVLNELVKQFPYCQTAHLLLVKCLHNENSIQYSTQLKTSAAFVSNRKVMYRLLNISETETVASAVIEKEVKGISTETPLRVLPKVELALPPIKTKEEVKPIINTSPDILEKPPVKEAAAEKKESVVPSKTKIEDSPTSGKLSAKEILEKRLREIAEAKGGQKPESAPKPIPLVKKEEPVLKSVQAEFIEKKEAEKAELKMEETPKEVVKKASPAPIEQKTHTIEILQEQPTEQKEIRREPVKHRNLAEEKHSFTDWLKVKASPIVDEETESQEPDTEKIAGQKGLIDKFIKTEARLSPPKKEFFNPVNMARQSLTEYDDLVTETLAKIYFDQGKYEKAISSYEKLSLLFPEKYATFAAQIKAIHQLINEK